MAQVIGRSGSFCDFFFKLQYFSQFKKKKSPLLILKIEFVSGEIEDPEH